MFNKKKYRFEFSQVQNIHTDAIKNAADLVNYIMGENQKLIDLNETGSLVVSKIESSKKGERVLFAQRVELPMERKTNFDALLEPFYTKQLLDFDESILEIQDERSQVIKDTLSKSRQNEISYAITPQNSNIREENDGDYAPAPQLDLSDEEEESEVDSESNKQVITEEQSEPTNERLRTEINVPSSTLLTEATIKEIVAKELREKDEEIDRLSQELKSKDKQEIVETDNQSRKEENIPDAILPTPHKASELSEDINVLEMIKMVKTEANKHLNDFIAQETAKINAEIEALDTRDKIEDTLSKQLGDEKEIEIKELNLTIDSEKNDAVTAENARHQAALATIETEHEADRAAKLKALKDKYTDKLSSAIKEEYERQTEQLNLILQGKTEELQLRQKAVNEGMKNTVSEVLEGFNTNHGEVIQTVERRKNSSGVISLHQRVG